MKIDPTRAANYRDANGNYLGRGPSPTIVRHQGPTLRSIVANGSQPTTLRQIVPASGRTRRKFGRRL